MQTPWGDFAVTDAHIHFFSRRFFAAMGSQCGKTPEQVAETLDWSLPPEDPVELARTWAAELDTQLTNELAGDPVKRSKGLRQRINDERAKRADVVAEADFVRPLLINTVVESELILKRQKSLRARVGELEKDKVAGAAGRSVWQQSMSAWREAGLVIHVTIFEARRLAPIATETEGTDRRNSSADCADCADR